MASVVPVLETEGLCVSYGAIGALRGIDLRVEEGEVVVVVGPNGAGKSSLLNAISGVVSPRAGQVRSRGRDITGWPSHRLARTGIVQVPEGRRVFVPLTVEENLLLGGYAQRDRKRQAELLGWIYDMFPRLRERRDSPAGLLSGGEQQMVAFGRALMSDPYLMLLDEPSMGLAPVMVDVVTEAVAAFSARGLSILMVEQNAEAAFSVANRAYVLELGEIVLSGKAADVAADPQVLVSFLGGGG